MKQYLRILRRPQGETRERQSIPAHQSRALARRHGGGCRRLPAHVRHLRQSAATFARLETAILADDAAQVKREAHSLKSMTALVAPPS
jgi:HPt (histidine-containing phosphotransfer) domain-containing protein